jgi:hypothetical protein
MGTLSRPVQPAPIAHSTATGNGPASRSMNQRHSLMQSSLRKTFRSFISAIKVGGKIKGIPFLHRQLKPINEIEFDEDPRQGNLDFINECEGMCGV